MAIEPNPALAELFPHLADEGYAETSPPSIQYNCIAWAAGRSDEWWWPDALGAYFWPETVPRTETMEAYIQTFELLGYVRCADYERDGKPTHAARQLTDGTWTSKLGRQVDVRHTLHALEGAIYGKVAAFLRRRSAAT
jgi:hypothetical protein